MSTVRTEVLEIRYETGGPADGTPVVLVHGWPDAARGWLPVAAELHRHGWASVTADLRGSGGTRFRSPSTPRDGTAVALAQDVLDLTDRLGLERFAVLGHDWGARAAYTLAALAPHRVTAIAGLALAYQPGGRFTMPGWAQARAYWYQWVMFHEAGAQAIRDDPAGFARCQWETWSPPGWFTDEEFAATAESFADPDWTAVTLNAYRSRFLPGEPGDPRYDSLRARLAEVELLATPTLMIQGGADRCDPPAHSEGLQRYFTGPYRRVVLDGVGHFPHREAPDQVARLVHEHLEAHRA